VAQSRCAYNLRSAFGLLQERLGSLGVLDPSAADASPADAPQAAAAAAEQPAAAPAGAPPSLQRNASAAAAVAAVAGGAPLEDARFMRALMGAALRAYDKKTAAESGGGAGASTRPVPPPQLAPPAPLAVAADAMST
jgi:hypothetical protein